MQKNCGVMDYLCKKIWKPMKICNILNNLFSTKSECDTIAFDSIVNSLQQHKVNVNVDQYNGLCKFEVGVNYVVKSNVDDPHYIRLISPEICEINENNELYLLRVITLINSSVKLVKFVIEGTSVHMVIPFYLDSEKITEEMLFRCFNIGQVAYQQFQEEWKRVEKNCPTKRIRVLGFH